MLLNTNLCERDRKQSKLLFILTGYKSQQQSRNIMKYICFQSKHNLYPKEYEMIWIYSIGNQFHFRFAVKETMSPIKYDFNQAHSVLLSANQMIHI